MGAPVTIREVVDVMACDFLARRLLRFGECAGNLHNRTVIAIDHIFINFFPGSRNRGRK